MYFGSSGSWRGCLPVASNTALAIAAWTNPFGPSPAPAYAPTKRVFRRDSRKRLSSAPIGRLRANGF